MCTLNIIIQMAYGKVFRPKKYILKIVAAYKLFIIIAELRSTHPINDKYFPKIPNLE